MFGPDLDRYESKLRAQRRSLKIGLWAFLFTGRKQDDRQFFDLYADYIDRTAGEDWHCIGFAKSIPPTAVDGRGWRDDDRSHALSQEIRQHIRTDLITPHATAIVFFNPFNIVQEGRGIYIPLDGARLSNENIMRRDLDIITEAVRRSRGTDIDDVRTEFGIDNRLSSLQRSLTAQQFRGVVKAVIDRAIGPALGRLFSLET
ncbi:hypothetical protein [Limobrevibacterium gyesilva]|uniref:Uncharacterized protein n=1 Tax=Limobrevibacterium gyesilva TaxID=2991712 RepID=A0AA41YPZ2_9PROT|nr:hypothetical protein [Limobrevibacterium gyesilva]MCW3474355.1 hypothetical protein [Limobrevibacterium gyesilva]